MKFSKNVDVCLVSMPISDITMPSMALSLLKSCLSEAGISSVVHYEHLYYARRLGLDQYQSIAFSRNDFLAGEMIFAASAHPKTIRTLSEYMDWMREIRIPMGTDAGAEYTMPKISWLQDLPALQLDAEDYIEEAAGRILALRPKIVAFASMFQQTNASIALARRLKREKNPPFILVGGANCMGELGVALIEYIKDYDYVFVGEADEVFVDVCRRLLTEGNIPPEKLPYGVLSRLSPRPETAPHRVTKNIEALPVPDFDDFFTVFKELFPAEQSIIRFMVEGSRGCWWGKKKPCTFCGLNGPARNYREKTTRRLVDEIAVLSRKYPEAETCIFTDSILSYTQMKELPAAIHNAQIRMQFFSEIKSNLTEQDVRSLADAGFVHLQPGVENLQDDVLSIMNKGCRAIRQIQTLKSCRAHNVQVTWNMLSGFPGEKEEHFWELAQLIPKLMHLTAPKQFVHIMYQRYGEYTEHPEKYGLCLRPARVYDYVFADKEFIRRSAFMYEPVDEVELGIYWNINKKGEAWQTVRSLVIQWAGERLQPQRLDMEERGNGIDIYDMRTVARHTIYRLEGVKADLYRALRTVRQEASLQTEFAGTYSEPEIKEALEWLCTENLTVKIGTEYLALAVDAGEH